jgi:hypothetical protein
MNVLINIKNQVAGRFTLHKGKVDAEGNPIPGTHTFLTSFDNLITDGGMDMFYSTASDGTLSTRDILARCHVGTGNTAPAVTDTQLATWLATHNTNMGGTVAFSDDATHPYWYATRIYRFEAGTATGNVAEVGIGRSKLALFSRALTESGGVPTTITILSDEYLDVTYEMRNYIDPTGGTAIATISGVPYDVDYLPYEIDTAPSIYYPISQEPSGSSGNMRVYSTDVLGTVYTGPSGSASADLGLTWAAYVAGNHYADGTGSWGLSAGNFVGGIGTASIETTQGKYQFNFSPKIPKDATKVLTLTVRISWDRYP